MFVWVHKSFRKRKEKREQLDVGKDKNEVQMKCRRLITLFFSSEQEQSSI